MNGEETVQVEVPAPERQQEAPQPSGVNPYSEAYRRQAQAFEEEAARLESDPEYALRRHQEVAAMQRAQDMITGLKPEELEDLKSQNFETWQEAQEYRDSLIARRALSGRAPEPKRQKRYSEMTAAERAQLTPAQRDALVAKELEAPGQVPSPRPEPSVWLNRKFRRLGR